MHARSGPASAADRQQGVERGGLRAARHARPSERMLATHRRLDRVRSARTGLASHAGCGRLAQSRTPIDRDTWSNPATCSTQHDDDPDEERGHEPKLLGGGSVALPSLSSTAQGRHAASNTRQQYRRAAAARSAPASCRRATTVACPIVPHPRTARLAGNSSENASIQIERGNPRRGGRRSSGSTCSPTDGDSQEARNDGDESVRTARWRVRHRSSG
jgi:hypothetical protein